MEATALDQILMVEPSQKLIFKSPFNKEVTSYLKLVNTCKEKRVVFKFRCTHPKHYRVVPSAGLLSPNPSSVIVKFTLLPLKNYLDLKLKHKILIQATIVKNNKLGSYHKRLWSEALPNEIFKKKLNCVFETSEEEKMVDIKSGGLLPQQNESDDDDDSLLKENLVHWLFNEGFRSGHTVRRDSGSGL